MKKLKTAINSAEKKTTLLLPGTKDIKNSKEQAKRLDTLNQYGIKAAKNILDAKHVDGVIKEIKEEFNQKYEVMSEKDLFAYINKYGLVIISPSKFDGKLTKKMEDDIIKFLESEEYIAHLDHYIVCTPSKKPVGLIARASTRSDQASNTGDKFVVIGDYSKKLSSIFRRTISFFTRWKEINMLVTPFILSMILIQIISLIFGYTPLAVAIILWVIITVCSYILHSEQLSFSSSEGDCLYYSTAISLYNGIGRLKISADQMGYSHDYWRRNISKNYVAKSVITHILIGITILILTNSVLPTMTLSPLQNERTINCGCADPSFIIRDSDIPIFSSIK